jgi:uncharacterized protein (DUF2267 family)
MAGTTVISLDRSVQLTMEWMHGIRNELGWDDDERVYDATKAVLHAVRDRLPIEESAKFSAQLPLVMKGIYYEQYDPTGKPLTIRSREEFLELVRSNFTGALDAEEAVRGVMRGLSRKMGKDALEKVALHMPGNIKDLFEVA